MKNTGDRVPFRILIADDDKDDIQLTKDCFDENKLNVKIDEVADGQHLVELLQGKGKSYPFKDLPQLILLDLNMPRKSGFEALVEIKADENLCKIPIIVFTTSKSPKDIEKAYLLGANCFVSKPNTLDEWCEKMGQLGRFWIDCVKQGHNVIVARTFSKLYGFAGLRVGYAVLPQDLTTKIEPYFSGLWSMSGPAIQAALASYQDREFLDGALKKTTASKEFLYEVLKKEGYTYIPSSTNFVMFPINMPGERFADEMMKRGVGLRHWEFNNKNWCRISIGRMDEMQAFAAAFKEIS